MTTTSLLYVHDPETAIDLNAVTFDPYVTVKGPDAMLQNPVLREILAILSFHFTAGGASPDTFLDNETLICYDRRNRNIRIAPDCYIAFGVDAFAIRRRGIYETWVVGKPPDFALEIASPSTALNDIIDKRLKYAQIGIPEYWRFDPSGGDHYGLALEGEILEGGAYRTVDLTTEPDGVLKGYSPALGLYLCQRDDMLRFYDPETGEYLRNFQEEREGRLAAEAALRAERARTRRLEEELRRRGW